MNLCPPCVLFPLLFRYVEMFIRPSRFNFIKRSNIFTPGSRSLKTSSHTFQKINRDNTPGETVRDSNETPKKIAASVETVLDRGKEKLFEVVSIYEEAIGLKEIKEAQDNVLKVYFRRVNSTVIISVTILLNM